MSKVNPNPQLGYEDTVPELKRTLAAILREHAQYISGLCDGTVVSTMTVLPVSSVSGVLTLDLSLSALFTCTLTENITSILFTNPPPPGYGIPFALHITQHASAAKTVTGWPSGLTGNWFGGAYVASVGLSAKDEIGFTYYSSSLITGKYANGST